MNRIAEFAKNLGKDSGNGVKGNGVKDNGSANVGKNAGAQGAGAKGTDLETNSAKGTPEPSSPRTLPTEPDHAAAGELQKLLDGKAAPYRKAVREALEEKDLKLSLDGGIDAVRDRMYEHIKFLVESGESRHSFSKENGGSGNALAAVSGIETIGSVNPSLTIKSGVQWGLWGGAVDNLGSERHRHYIEKIQNAELLGCYAMTERGHGSNVQELETTATYDPDTHEFIINSPTDSARKVYIGNAGRDGRMAAVFAQLYTPGEEESHGVHCLIVPIRDEDGNPLDGVEIGDHGRKGGLLGVDNGTLLFNNVRVPRENLLNRFGDVEEDGTYVSPIDSRNRRFFTMLGTLIRGRITVGGAGLAATRTASDIAIRYANRRRQFEGGEKGVEKRLIDYRQHRRRLLIPLARTYALTLLQNRILERYDDMLNKQASGQWSVTDPTEEQLFASREMESLAAAVKAASTEHANKTLQEMREACGGAGYMSENLLTTLRADADIYSTFEGDNTVLIQMVGKHLLTAFGRDMQDLSPWDMVKYGVETAADTVRRRTGIRSGVQSVIDLVSNRDEDSLFDAGYQVKLIEDREQAVLRSLVRRIAPARKADRAEAAEIVDKTQDHLIAVSWAHVDSLLMRTMVEAELELPEGSAARQVFEQVRSLFFFDLLIKHAGWYQEHNMLPSGRVKAARAAINDLVDSLGPWSQVLSEAFATPKSAWNVPMLNDGGVDGGNNSVSA